MDSLPHGVHSLPLVKEPTRMSYNLTLGEDSEIASHSGKLASVSATGHLTANDEKGEASEDLTCLIIQEHLEVDEETTNKESDGAFCSGATEEQGDYPKTEPEGEFRDTIDTGVMDDGETILAVAETDDAAKTSSDGQSLVIVNVGEDGETEAQVVCDGADQTQETGYLVYNPADRSLRVASPRVTPLLVLASNGEKRTYEANVVLSQSTELSQLVKLHAPVTETPADPSTITMTIEADTQLLFNGQQASGQLLYVCNMDQCGAAFDFLEEYHQHQACHMTQNTSRFSGNCPAQDDRYSRQLVCPHEGCLRTFAWPTHLKYHELTHTGKRMFRCEVQGCGACFYTVQRLTVHRRVHTGEKPFVCTEPNCGKAFTTQGNLKNHTRIHSGEKPYGCDFIGCPKRFAEHSSLRKHTLVHTGTKPYECDICGKKFSQSGSRNVHMKRHQVLNEEQLLASESVVFSNPVTDHVVTVTTQPSESGEPHSKMVAKTDELCQQDDQGHIRILTSMAGANVVVLSQPEEMVAMAPGYHHEREENPKDMVYACHQLLNVDVS